MSMVQTAERVFVVGEKSAIGASLIKRLLDLGHPRSHIEVASSVHVDWSDQDAVCAFLTEEPPDLVCVVEPTAGACPHWPPGLWPAGLIAAAAQARVVRLMYVCPATRWPRTATGTHNSGTAEHPLESHQAALLRCAVLAEQGLDYRSVSTCEAYGPGPAGIGTASASAAADLIEHLLLQFADATARRLDRLTIQTRCADRLQLMNLNDIADAVAHVMDLPRKAIEAVTGQRSLHIHLGAARVVSLAELVRTTAVAAGYRGHVQLEAPASAGHAAELDHNTLDQLGWQPLIPLEVGLELAVMEFRLRHRVHQRALCTT